MRIIDADVLMELKWETYTSVGYVEVVAIDDIENVPTIEAEPVRHGRWIFDGAIYYDEDEKCYDYQCSECGRFVSVRGGNLGKEELEEEYPYCHCGAKMDLKE